MLSLYKVHYYYDVDFSFFESFPNLNLPFHLNSLTPFTHLYYYYYYFYYYYFFSLLQSSK